MSIPLIVTVGSGIYYNRHIMSTAEPPFPEAPTFSEKSSGPISRHCVLIRSYRNKNGPAHPEGIRKHMHPHALAGVPGAFSEHSLYFGALPDPFVFGESCVGDIEASPAWVGQ